MKAPFHWAPNIPHQISFSKSFTKILELRESRLFTKKIDNDAFADDLSQFIPFLTKLASLKPQNEEERLPQTIFHYQLTIAKSKRIMNEFMAFIFTHELNMTQFYTDVHYVNRQ